MVVKSSSQPKVELTARDTSRLFIALVGAVVLSASLVTPWWTRGLTIDWDEDDNPRPIGTPAEGFYVQYRPYSTPGGFAGLSTDAGRETATAVLGIALTLCAAFAAAAGALRVGKRLGWLDVSDDAPVRFAIGAFIVGTFAVLWGAFFLPLLGPNPGWLYGEEAQVSPEETFDGGDGATFIEDVRYANVGFFLGIVGGVAFPAFLWYDAAQARALNWTGTQSSKPSAGTLTF